MTHCLGLVGRNTEKTIVLFEINTLEFFKV